MHLPGQDFARLQAAVVAAFTCDELRRLLKVKLDTNLETITSDKGFEAQVFDVLLWIERHERLPAFAASALAANPTNEELAAACAAVYAAARPQRESTSKQRTFVHEHGDSGRLAAMLGIEWVAIPGGVLRMGSNAQRDVSAQLAEMPQHDVTMPDYWIARCPITNYQYQVFVYTTEHVSPPHWRKGTSPDGKQDHPVVNISWSDALAFCRWANVQLPSEAEWEWAAAELMADCGLGRRAPHAGTLQFWACNCQDYPCHAFSKRSHNTWGAGYGRQRMGMDSQPMAALPVRGRGRARKRSPRRAARRTRWFL